jgi:hypothetical protein
MAGLGSAQDCAITAGTARGESSRTNAGGAIPPMAADQFVWATSGTLLLAALVLVSRRPAATHALAIATVVGTVLVAASAIRVGHAGGRHVHNAGAAYSVSTPRAAAAVTDVADPKGHRENDDR